MNSEVDASQILTFRAGTDWFALPTSRVLRVCHYPAMAHPPGRPGFLEGFVNFRGVTAPVLSLGELFGFEHHSSNFYRPVVFLRSDGDITGLLVDALGGIVSPGEWRSGAVAPDRVFNDVVRAVAYLGDETRANVIDPERLLLREERTRIEDFRAQAAERLEALA